MAEGKKSFIAYSDWKNIFDELPNEDAGVLIKHIFAYVNDENPVSDSVLIKAVFANIKSTLKRDLEKWDNQLKQRIEAGKKSGVSRRTKTNDRSTLVNEHERKRTVSVNDNVNDSVLLEKETKHIYTFTDFWQVYPKKVEKQKCEKIFSKLKADEILKIKETLPNFISYKPFESYTHPNPQTYLNGKRWEDEITVISKPAYTGTNQLQPKYDD